MCWILGFRRGGWGKVCGFLVFGFVLGVGVGVMLEGCRLWCEVGFSGFKLIWIFFRWLILRESCHELLLVVLGDV